MDKFNDPIIKYKNFKMGTEIDIAGTFIYNGMKDLEQMDAFDYESEVFSFLYHIAVGIERLQKVLLVILEEINENNMAEFEESLITHSHQYLQDKIKKKCNIEFNSRENSFLQVLNEFYKKCRYNRFNISGEYDAEKRILCEYIRNNLHGSEYKGDFIINNNKIKELLGRVIGSISRKYYNEIYNLSSKQNIYTYELRNESKARKIFLPELRKDSLQDQTMNEKVAFKEFITFLVNTHEENSFIRFLRKIEPLELDVALANQYLEDIIKGTISQELIDTVDYLYGENSYSGDRIEMIDCIGNTRVMFERFDVDECYSMLKELISGDLPCHEFAVEFPKIIMRLEDEDVVNLLKDTKRICEDFMRKREIRIDNSREFLDLMKEVYDDFKNICYFG
ncbi:hypothetical protein LAV44_14970 [Clostridium sporogenes]|uniref:hypothetical protein n=1 Tax=Clostridium sporogenes TaxID=1509 RepID=UPI0022380C3F|nr:hypothetical protein [Clostridium sporogenes]MCW6076608.1 hypothetical protein [Clostridium sporogenes]